MDINGDDCLEIQVKTVIHELTHYGLEGENLDEIDDGFNKAMILGNPSTEQRMKMEELETQIETITEEFYKRNPPLVQYIREKLSVNNKKPFHI